jgi:hypothetical protein
MTERAPRWHDSQFGFRRGRSTVDAVKRVRATTEAMVSRKEVALAVSLDVTNAVTNKSNLDFGEVPQRSMDRVHQ